MRFSWALIGMVMVVLVMGINLYVYRHLVAKTVKSRRVRAVLAAVFVLLAGMTLASRALRGVLPDEAKKVLSFVGWGWFALSGYVFLALVLAKLGVWAYEKVRARRLAAQSSMGPSLVPEGPGAAAYVAPRHQPDSPERRDFLTKLTAGTALIAGGGPIGYGAWSAFTPPGVTEVAVKLPNLPKALDGFTLVQISDVHIGGILQRKFFDAVVAQMNGLKPDLVAVTGDLVDGEVEDLGHSVAALENVRAKYGAWFCTGNHDYYSGANAWVAALDRMGVKSLRNARTSIGDAGASFDLIGVDDWGARRRGYGRGYDLDKALEGRDPERASVLLAHQPANFDEAAKRGIGLQLSGHTHAGQAFPGTVIVPLVWPWYEGLYREGDGQIFVSRGCGFWGPPLRIGAPPEIVKITLVA